MIWLQVAVIIGATTLYSDAFETECDPARGVPSKTGPLSEKMKLPESYKVSGVVSNWMSNTTSAFVEAANSERLSTMISSREVSLQWLEVKPDNATFLYNKTAGNCATSKADPLAAFVELSQVSSKLSSFSTLISGLLDFSKASAGELRDNQVVGGIEGVRWVTCKNGSSGSPNLQVEVVFAGENGSLKPPSPAFNNPLVLFVRISEYGNFSDKNTLKSQLSVEFDSYDTVPSDSEIFSTPAGTMCDGWKEAPIPQNVSDPFSASMEVVDDKGKYEAMVHYSAKDQIVVVNGAKKDGVVPFINEANVPDSVVYVIHDFKRGYEYFLDQDSCDLKPLPNTSADVVSSDGSLSMRPVAQLLIAPELKFGKYGQMKTDDGRMHDVFRASDGKTGEVVEVHFDGDRLDSYSTYKLANGHPVMSSFVRYTPVPFAGTSQFKEQMRACFVKTSTEHSDNSTFIFDVKGKSVTDVYSQGAEAVTSALADALAEVAPVHPLRVRAFYDSGAKGSLRVFFSVGEKTNVEPAAVATYNYSAEVPSYELLSKLNDTISKGDWKFTVSTAEKKTEDWVVSAQSLKRFNSTIPVPPSYGGYTGGAMFVMGVFALVLGVGIGAGGVFFVTKRQRISTLAYQVFE